MTLRPEDVVLPAGVTHSQTYVEVGRRCWAGTGEAMGGCRHVAEDNPLGLCDEHFEEITGRPAPRLENDRDIQTVGC